MTRNTSRLIGLAMLMLAARASAQGPAPAAAPFELFARHPELYEARLSPSGEYLALVTPANGGQETRLEVLHLDGSGKTQVLRFPQKQHVADVTWTSDQQLVLSRARTLPTERKPASFGKLMTTDINGKNQDLLFGYERDEMTRSGRRQDQGFATTVGVLENEPGKLLVAFRCWDCGDEPDTTIYKVDAVEGGRTQIERSHGPADFVFDRSGRARIRMASNADGDPVISYRRTAESDWAPMPASLVGDAIHWARFTASPDVAYAEISDRGAAPRLYRVDFAKGTRTELAYHPDFEADDILVAGRSGEPFGAIYTAGKPAVRYFDPASEWAQLHAGLMHLFKGEMVRFVDVSRNGQRVLLTVSSDRHPGAYYLYDRQGGKIQLIGETAPWIRPDAMAPMTPVEFAARDGQKIFGFYTAGGPGPRPLVVMPHGGPFGISDHWGYDADVQFLASRGYGVLQVNYRGSGRRGSAFQRAGWKHWGDLLIDDLVDGVRWVTARGLADAGRVCIYGASYGGYAALQAPRVAPGAFRCAVGYAGLYDLPLDQKKVTNVATKRFYARTLGTDPGELARISPARHASELKVPVLLIHGREDDNTRFDQYTTMVDALTAAGNAPQTYVVTGEGHGFYSPGAQAELYRRLDAFLARSLDAGAAAAR